MSFRLILRWVRANLMAMGCDLENIDIIDGLDAIRAASCCVPPKVCGILDFLGKKKETLYLNKQEPLSASLAINPGQKKMATGIRSAEQFMMLAKAGYANYLPKE